MAKLKSPAAGAKADAKPGTDALRGLLNYFSTDTFPVLRCGPIPRYDETLGQEGAKIARKAMEYLEAGNAQEAVRWAYDAMVMYATIEKRNLQFEYAANLSEKWRKNVEPSVRREINRRNAQAKKLRVPADTVDRANELMVRYHGQSPRPKKTSAAKMAARKLAVDGPKVSYKTIINHLPSWLQAWND